MIVASWTVPSHIKAITTVSDGGNSVTPFASNNLALHVGDCSDTVASNRALLRQNLPGEPLWLEQVHSTIIVDADSYACCDSSSDVVRGPVADGAITRVPNRVLAVMTADCLPLLICDKAGTQVAAVHAGWRGLANGIVEQCIAKFSAPSNHLSVWLGPAIGPSAFEVGQDVVDEFTAQRPQDLKFFKPVADKTKVDKTNVKKFKADLYGLARSRLLSLGVVDISGGDYCTYTQDDLFFSYRRDGQTGRMASLIWIEQQ
jgi:purine-nucleoside/S-methyl-5'-thioadenosine phosphorylase / adenosine deaminase